MRRTVLGAGLALLAVILLSPERVQAWGGAHTSTPPANVGGLYHSGGATWDPYTGTWSGGRYGPASRPQAPAAPDFGHPYGSTNYPYYGGYLDNSDFSYELRTGTWGP
jgi:hypothetical protein